MVTKIKYIPRYGDLVWLNFEPQAGREQRGRRPAVVVSSTAYNEVVGLAIFCPVTSKIKGYPFEVPLPESNKISGVILSDQVKSLDWHERNAEFIEKLDPLTMSRVSSLMKKIISDF
jgi:mRNA interferase MazF